MTGASAGQLTPAPRFAIAAVLLVWAVFDGAWIAVFVQNGWVGLDALIYVRAAAAWLAGLDPWQASYLGYTFAAPPPTLLPYAPLTVLPESVAAVVLTIACAAAVVATVRILRFPLYWILFPPLFNAILPANPDAFLVLLIVGTPPAIRWLAPILKVYAVVPLLAMRDWRTLALTGLVVLVTAPFLPWGTYLADFGAIQGALAAQSGGGLSAWGSPLLMIAGSIALVAIRLPRAGWLAVPVLWPSTQFHYAALATPVARPLVLATVLALPLPGMTVLAVALLAIAERLRGRWPPLSILLRAI